MKLGCSLWAAILLVVQKKTFAHVNWGFLRRLYHSARRHRWHALIGELHALVGGGLSIVSLFVWATEQHCVPIFFNKQVKNIEASLRSSYWIFSVWVFCLFFFTKISNEIYFPAHPLAMTIDHIPSVSRFEKLYSILDKNAWLVGTFISYHREIILFGEYFASSII